MPQKWLPMIQSFIYSVPQNLSTLLFLRRSNTNIGTKIVSQMMNDAKLKSFFQSLISNYPITVRQCARLQTQLRSLLRIMCECDNKCVHKQCSDFIPSNFFHSTPIKINSQCLLLNMSVSFSYLHEFPRKIYSISLPSTKYTKHLV